MKTADPKLVSLELDIMWSQVAGVNPVGSERYGKRVALMHLKNVATGCAAAVQRTGPARLRLTRSEMALSTSRLF